MEVKYEGMFTIGIFVGVGTFVEAHHILGEDSHFAFHSLYIWALVKIGSILCSVGFIYLMDRLTIYKDILTSFYKVAELSEFFLTFLSLVDVLGHVP